MDSSEKTAIHPDIEALLARLEEPHDGSSNTQPEPLGTSQNHIVPELFLRTDPNVGLRDVDVALRRRQFGYNELRENNPNHIRKLLSFFVGPIQFVMEAAIVLSFGLGNWIDGGVVCGLLVLNAIVGFSQDARAGSIVRELKKSLTLSCLVLRHEWQELDARELVPGDIIRLEEGFICPADGRLVTTSAESLQVDQSALTGESLPVIKTTEDLVLQSSLIRNGSGIMLVTATGDNTFVGQASELVKTATLDRGHFTEIINNIGYTLLCMVMVTLTLTWSAAFWRSTNLKKISQHSLSLVIIGVPVGLPAVVTTTMAVGAAYLAKRKAIVQNLSAIESLAGVEVLCSDKTGTLTKNQLTIGEARLFPGFTQDDLLLTACSAASWTANNLDAIDKACFQLLKNCPGAINIFSSYTMIKFRPFDPESKRVEAIVLNQDGRKTTCVKGAPKAVMRLVDADSDSPNALHLDNIREVVEGFAKRGLRSVAVARQEEGRPWELVGILPFFDPPRDDTAITIREAQNLGLNIKMLTGDETGIAKETCRQLGLGDNIRSPDRLGIDGSKELSETTVAEFVEAADGFAEVFPQHKYKVVKILQERGYLVAMTGDGVNDAPSLKKADTGIAVQGASNAARSAADIVFLAPGLSAIIDAIKVSRQIFHRMYSYIVYRIALSLHLLIFFAIWICRENENLNLTLVVFIAIFADVATLAIAYDRAPYAERPVKWNLPKLWGMAIVLGIILALASLLCLQILEANTKTVPCEGTLKPKQCIGGAQQVWRGLVVESGEKDAVVFLEIVLTESWLILITRTAHGWRSTPSWQLTAAILVVDILATLFCYFGWFLTGSRTDPLSIVRIYLFSIGVAAILTMVHFVLSESIVFDNLMHARRLKYGRKGSRSKSDMKGVAPCTNYGR